MASSETTNYLATNYHFIVPWLIPWMHELCAISSAKTLSELSETPTKVQRLIPKSTLKFEAIRDEIIPQLFKFINSTSNPHKYLIDRFKYYINDNSNQLDDREMELFICSLISDLMNFIRYQHQTQLKNGNTHNKNNVLNNISPLEISIIIQYIKLLIDEYYQSAEYVYNETVCCQHLLTILNHAATHQRVIQKHNQNISQFSMYSHYLHENAKELEQSRKYIKELEDKLNTTLRKGIFSAFAFRTQCQYVCDYIQ